MIVIASMMQAVVLGMQSVVIGSFSILFIIEALLVFLREPSTVAKGKGKGPCEYCKISLIFRCFI